MEDKKEFPKGIFFKSPKDSAPDFIKGHISLSQEIVEYYNANKNDAGYVNLDLKEAKSGNLYLDLNDWTPSKD